MMRDQVTLPTVRVYLMWNFPWSICT